MVIDTINSNFIRKGDDFMRKRKWKKPMNAFLTVGIAASIVVPAYSSPVKAVTRTADVLISEYIEGSSFNKAIELYNGTGSDIDLTSYTLELYSNGAASASQSLKLSGTLKNGETYVLYHKDANADIKSKGDLANSTVINFNGDDAVILKKNGTVIDSIGQAGVAVDHLKDITLVRNQDHVSGDTNINDPFNPTKGWTALPRDDSSNLGLFGSETESPGNGDDGETGLQIHDIQGAGHQSPKLSEKVANLKGIVTYEYKIGSGNYFHMQTPDTLKDNDPKTSEGIVVYTGNKAANVEVGDLVSVAGTVEEYQIDGYFDTKRDTDLPVTEINARDDRGGAVTVVASNQPLPEAIKIDENLPKHVIDNDGFAQFDPEEDAIDYWESLEGMRVEVGSVKAVAPQEHGDLITVLENRETDTLHGGILLTEKQANSDRIQFKLYDNTAARTFAVATGDRFNGPITGVVNYGFQNYKIYADFEEIKAKHVPSGATPEKTSIVKNNRQLTIASYNLENFSNNKNETSEDKAQKLARAFAVDMQSPDIIGVTEVQDNNGQKSGNTAANESYERLISEIEKAGGVKYEYANIDPEVNQDGGAPNANIRVGFLYNPERVKLTKGMSHGDATTAVAFKNGKLTLNPGRIEPANAAFEDSRKPLAAQFDFRGERVIVIVNHWNSKSGDTPLFGSTQPPVYGSEQQRQNIANVVHAFIQKVKEDDPNANIISVGDFNDFQFSNALNILEGDLMTNMINTVDKSDRYTYLFQGNSQVLDHILVSNDLAKYTETDILHINADFTDMAGRASDHDPVLVQIDLQEKERQMKKDRKSKEKLSDR
jgi:predicted extracellular nuclease